MQNSTHCSLCSSEYDTESKIPRKIASCGHTFCSPCLENYVVGSDLLCPFGDSTTNIFGGGVNALPVNESCLKINHDRSSSNCKEHNKRYTSFCLRDRCLICDDCSRYSKHVGHKVKSIHEVEKEAKDKLKELQFTLETIGNYRDGVDNILKKSRIDLLKNVKEEFDHIRWLLVMKELELSFEINNYFDSEISKVKENLGESSAARNSIANDIKSINQCLKNQEWLKILNDEVLTSSSNLRLDDMHTKAEKLRTSFQETAESFRSALVTRIHPFIALIELPLNELSETSDLIYFDEEIEDNPIKKHHKEEIISVNENSGGQNRFNIDKKSFTIDKVQLYNIQNITAKCQDINYKDCRDIVFSLWSQIREVREIKLNFNSTNISDSELFDCCLLAGWTMNSVNSLEILLNSSNIKEYNIIPLISEITPRMTHLTNLRIELEKTNIADQSLIAFPTSVLANLKNLENFQLNVSDTKVTDESIAEVLNHLKDIRNINLNLSSTKISDQSFSKFNAQNPNRLNKIEFLSLDVSNTGVTDDSLMNLIMHLNSIKTLNINCRLTEVTDYFINSFIKFNLWKMKSLEHLKFTFENTQISFSAISDLLSSVYKQKHLEYVNLDDKTIEFHINYPQSIQNNIDSLDVNLSTSGVTSRELIRYFINMPTLKVCKLNLANAIVDDEVLEYLIKNLLSSAKSIKCLDLNIASTRITDHGMRLLFNALTNMETLSLDLSSTAVKDDSLIFLLNRLNYNNLLVKSIKINLNNTLVSDYYRRKIVDLMQSSRISF